MKSKYVLAGALLIFLGVSNHAQANNNEKQKIQQQILKLLERSVTNDKLGTNFKFVGCTLIIDETELGAKKGNCNFSNTRYRRMSEYDISEAVVDKLHNSQLQFYCDAGTSCISFKGTYVDRSTCTLKEPYVDNHFDNAGYTLRTSIDAIKVANLMSDLREECE